MSGPMVSVLVPAFNAGRWLAETLDSALAQSWANLEVIVVDDGSSDDTPQIAAAFAGRGVRLLSGPNRGASAARNIAFRESHGEFIQFLDADDLLSPDKIDRQVRTLLTSGGGRVAGCPWGRFTHRPDDARFVPEPTWRNQSAVDFLVACALGEFMYPPVAWLVPRSLCEAAGPWDERLSLNDDGEYFARVLARSSGIVFCEGARAYYRSNNPASYGSRMTAAAGSSELRAWDSIAATMLALRDDATVRLAVATGYQRLQVRYYPRFPAIVREARLRERQYGKGAYRVQGGLPFRVARGVLGWRAAIRLREVKSAILRSAK